MKKVFYTELAYVLGLAATAAGGALFAAANFGMAVVVAPAYLLHLKLSQIFSFFTFGMADYTLEGCLLLIMILVLRKFKPTYLVSFLYAVAYGLLLDGFSWLIGFVPTGSLAARVICYILGLLVCAAGISLIFHTYLSPAVYELLVKEIASRWNLADHRVKFVYDCISCLVAVIFSFSFFGFGNFVGIHVGTAVCALVSGWLIGRCTSFLEKHFEFRDRFPLRRYF